VGKAGDRDDRTLEVLPGRKPKTTGSLNGPPKERRRFEPVHAQWETR
jgi:hypothetical protein